MDTLRKWSGGLCFVFLVAVSVGLVIVFVHQQWHLVSDPVGFWSLIVVLIALAFLFSSVEAGFSVSNRDQSVSIAINPELARLAEEWSSLAAKAGSDIHKLTGKERRRRNRLEARSTHLAKRRRILLADAGRRIDIVGSLSALSVIVNTALAAFLPTFLDETGAGTLLGYDFEAAKTLIFVASALPIIYFGKIIPKTIGLSNPSWFAYRLYRVGEASFFIIGWMPRGLNWALAKIRPLLGGPATGRR